MADSVIRLTINSQEYDQKIKRAADGLRRFSDECRKVGGTMEVVEKDTLDYVKAIGQMETTSRTATGKLAELKKAFVEFSDVYKNMSEQEKRSPIGRALSQSLDQLKVRISDTKKQLEDINREMNGSKFGEFGAMIDTLGQKMGITGNITEMLTSNTALLTGAIGAGIAVVAKSTEAWAAYNTELAKQDQITTVTTGLKGDDAEKMTISMRALSRTYGADFRQSINAANTLMTQFGATGDEAIKLLKDGMQGMIMGDAPKLLQMIQQFAPAFRDAGVGASQLIAVIQNSEGGLFSEQNMNAILMGIKNIRLMTDSTSKALAKMGIDGQEMSRKMSDGSMTVFEALRQVATALEGAKAGSKEAGEVMQYVFGRQGAMQGMKLARAIAELNTNLEDTKKQTGEVGESMAQLQEANERLEVAIRACFGYDGWETMANGIKTQLVTALASVLELTIKIKDSWVGEISGTIFDTITSAAMNALGPLGRVLNIMNDIRKGFGGSGSGNGNQRTELDDFYDYIKGGTTKAERESRYNEKMSELLSRMSVLGQEKEIKNADGSTSFKIDPAELDYQKVLMQRRLELIAQREALLNAPFAPTNIVEPFTPITLGGGKKGKTAKVPTWDDFAKQNIHTNQYLEQNLGKALPEKVMPSVFALLSQNDKGFRDYFGINAKQWDLKKDITEKDYRKLPGYKKDEGSDLDKFNKDFSNVTSGVGSIVSGIQSMGVEIPKEIQDVLGILQGISTIMSGMSILLSLIQVDTKVTAVATTADAAIPFFARGGVVPHAAGGYMVPGTHYSGDVTPILANAGEVVLNRAQTAGLAQELEGGGTRNIHVSGTLRGTDLVIAIDRALQATGRGELVTWGK